MELELTKCSTPFIDHIDKVKPYLGIPPKCWLNGNIEPDVTELKESTGDDVETLEECEGDESSPVDSGPLLEPLASEPAEVVTFNESQEFKWTSPDEMFVDLLVLMTSCCRSWLVLM